MNDWHILQEKLSAFNFLLLLYQQFLLFSGFMKRSGPISVQLAKRNLSLGQIGPDIWQFTWVAKNLPKRYKKPFQYKN